MTDLKRYCNLLLYPINN